jgi:hypothetical protein
MSLIDRFENDSALALSRDARITAIRWDLVPWGLVLDLDSPVSEARDAGMRRVWLVFAGIGEVTLPVYNARLPSGIWLTSDLVASDIVHGSRHYTCQALLPQFDGNALREGRSSDEVVISAQALVGLASTRSTTPTEYGLSRAARIELCSDEDLLRVLGEV